MKQNYKLADAERAVMEILWQHPEPVSTRELLDMMNEKGKNWKRQTLNTLLFRLEDKKIVVRKRGYATPAMNAVELRQKQSQELLDNVYDGKFSVFCAALAGCESLTKSDAAEFDAMLKKVSNSKK